MLVYVKKEDLKLKFDSFVFDLVFDLVDEVMLEVLFEVVFELGLESVVYLNVDRIYFFGFLGDGYFEFFLLEDLFFCLVFCGSGLVIIVIVFGWDFRIVLSSLCIVVVFVVVCLDSIYVVEVR